MSDYIKREDAIKAVNKAKTEGLTECPTYYLGIVPSADVVPKDFHDKTCEAMAKRHREEVEKLMPKSGEWIAYEGGWKDLDYYPPKCKCNQCGYEEELYILNAKPTNFCPNCGAKMRERKESE